MKINITIVKIKHVSQNKVPTNWYCWNQCNASRLYRFYLYDNKDSAHFHCVSYDNIFISQNTDIIIAFFFLSFENVISLPRQHTENMSMTQKTFSFAKKHNMPFYFVSASDGTNVVKVGLELVVGSLLVSLSLSP